MNDIYCSNINSQQCGLDNHHCALYSQPNCLLPLLYDNICFIARITSKYLKEDFNPNYQANKTIKNDICFMIKALLIESVYIKNQKQVCTCISNKNAIELFKRIANDIDTIQECDDIKKK